MNTMIRRGRKSWFEPGKSIEYICECLESTQKNISIATAFFSVRGWNLIRRFTLCKETRVLVGLADPGEERARLALIDEIMRDLRTGLDRDRRQAVQDLVSKIQACEFGIVDARAKDHHNKLFIFDEDSAIQTSSNLTQKGLINQFEGGYLIQDRYEIRELLREFDDYFESANDLTQELLAILLKWLELCRPWEIYLKTLLALETIKDVESTYSKQPLIYQRDMISLTLKQIQDYGGSMLVASTGLGKTVVGTWVAIQLQKQGLIDKVLIICPNAVKESWRKEMRDASLSAELLTVETLDRDKATDLKYWDDCVNDIIGGKGRYLLIFDESHKLRKRFPDQRINFKKSNNVVAVERERKAFTRINDLVNKSDSAEKIKVLLMTGSPYGTDVKNINVQLHLLPHNAQPDQTLLFSEYFDDAKAWKIDKPEEIIQLPVAHQLTTPHVAKYYAREDEQGRYIYFGEQKKYFPNIDLSTISVPVILEQDLSDVICQGWLKTNARINSNNFNHQLKIAWTSSPLALQYFLECVVQTPKGERSFNFEKSSFIKSQPERQEFLKPLIKKLSNFDVLEDRKLQELIKIVTFQG